LKAKSLKKLSVIFFCLIATISWSQKDIGKLLDKSSLVYAENPAESFSLCETAEREATESGNHEFDGNISYCKARYYVLIAKYDACSREINKAIKIFIENDDKHNLSSAYSLKSILLGRIGDEEAAHKMLLNVVELDRETNNIDALIGTLNNLSLDYLHFQDADSMLYVLQELETLKEKFEETDYLYYHQNWGHYHVLNKNYQKGILEYELALEVAEKQKMTDSKATNLAALSKGYRLLGDYDKAVQYAEESYKFSQENNLIYETSEALIEWIAVKEDIKDYKGAFEIQKKWVRVDKKINDLERIQKVNAIEGQLKIAEKEQEIAEGEIALQKSNLEGEKARTRNAWLIGVVLLVIVLLVFTAFIYAKTKKLNTTINEQKKEVELKSLNLETALISVHDSLNYSKLIQDAMLPKKEHFSAAFKEHFILFKPKDIVSGDFYWLHQDGDEIIYAVGDCTGHGVPGAMVSMVCHEALNKAVKRRAFINQQKY